MFVDNYNAWVTGPSAVANCKDIQAIINRAINWEKQNGTTFESEKTILVHFIRNADWTNTTLFIIKGKTVALGHTAKILGVVMDVELWYKQYIAKAVIKGFITVMALKRL